MVITIFSQLESKYLSSSGRTIMNSPIKVNWAYTSSTSAAAREETSTHFSIFIGDLATEISDATLRQKFAQYTSLSDARVMWDMKSGRSRGYGFCSFEDRDDAERAILEMTGTFLGSRAIRCNWANLKHSTSPVEALAVNAHPQSVVDVNQQYSLVLFQTPYSLSTIYLGNLAIDIEVKDLEVLFSGYGGAQDIKLHADRGFAFVKLGSHDSAALAIVQLQGAIVKGRPLKVSCKIVAKMLDLRADHTGQNKSEPQLRARSSSVTNPTSSQDLLSQSPHSSSLVQGYSHESVNHGFSMIPRQIAALQYMTGEQVHDFAQSYSRQRFDSSYAPGVTMQNRSVY